MRQENQNAASQMQTLLRHYDLVLQTPLPSFFLVSPRLLPAQTLAAQPQVCQPKPCKTDLFCPLVAKEGRGFAGKRYLFSWYWCWLVVASVSPWRCV